MKLQMLDSGINKLLVYYNMQILHYQEEEVLQNGMTKLHKLEMLLQELDLHQILLIKPLEVNILIHLKI